MEEKKDIKIKCEDCGEPFLFRVSDQNFYEEKGFPPPKRCKTCRDARKDRRFAKNRENIL